jgi:hypothetical protein
MDLTLIQQFLQYGIFAGLFVALFVYTLKNNEKRETALTDTLKEFAEKTGTALNDMQKDITEIKEDIENIKNK